MNQEQFIEFLESYEFTVHLVGDEQMEAEIETWTKDGVNIVFPMGELSPEAFIECVEDFDVDVEIDLHRQDDRYKNTFTIRESLEDFESFKNMLDEMVEILKKMIDEK